GLNAGENMDIRLRGGLPRANAVKHVHEKHGVNCLGCICAIDRAVLTASMDFWVPGVRVAGLHELVANALVLEGENERTTNLRGEEIADLMEENEE
ncbi:MAG: (Fe-S)-binding protein, partial [Deltaproteobacteria bacterium]|nr:(Fe-S)-binding protein [Deltaproteobacteria bacterium]